MSSDFFDDEIPGVAGGASEGHAEGPSGESFEAPENATMPIAEHEPEGGREGDHEAQEPPVFDVEAEDQGEVPAAPTGAAFGEASSPEPVGANRKAIMTIAAVAFGLIALVIIGVVIAVASPNSAAAPLAPGSSPNPSHIKESDLGVHHTAGVMSSQAFGRMDTSSSTPQPRVTSVPCTVTPSGMTGPCGNAPALSPECQREFSPDYVGARSPACIAQANGGRPVAKSGGSYQGGGNGGNAQPTPLPTEDPAEIAAERERQEEVAMQRAAAQAPVFVPDGSGTAPQPPTGNGGSGGSGSDQNSQGGSQSGSQSAAGGAGSLGYSGASGSAAPQQSANVPEYVMPAPIRPYNVPSNYLAVGAGSWIDVSLYNEVNLALPGGIVAEVQHPICDTKTGAYELIPPGAKFIGATGPGFALQGRADALWTLLRMRDGDEYSLDTLHSQNAQGTSGIDARQDDHRWAIARTGFLSAIVATAAGILENRSLPSNSVVLTTSAGSGGMSSGVPIIENTANRIINLDAAKPTEYRIPHGITFRLYVAQPIYLPPYPGSVGCKPFSQ